MVHVAGGTGQDITERGELKKLASLLGERLGQYRPSNPSGKRVLSVVLQIRLTPRSQALSATIESPQEQQNDHHARAVFEHRSAPLQLKNPSSMAENDAYSYDAYKKSRTAARKVSVRLVSRLRCRVS